MYDKLLRKWIKNLSEGFCDLLCCYKHHAYRNEYLGIDRSNLYNMLNDESDELLNIFN
jgi:hypothetical protein